MTEKTWWATQPVYPKTNQLPMTIIGEIPLPIVSEDYRVFRFNAKYLAELQAFINSNYITGYQYSTDYLNRKLEIPGSTALVLMNIQNLIFGFIYCQPFIFKNLKVGYVDLMTVSKDVRGKGLAKILISHIVYYSGFQSYIHKKESAPLPLPYFFRDKYYSIPLAALKYKYSLTPDNSNKIQYFETGNGILKTSESVRTFKLKSGNKISFTIHGFSYGILRNALLAEVFYIDLAEYSEVLYQEFIGNLLSIGVDFLVVLASYQFFRTPIKDDNYLEGKELFLHSYNLYVPTLKDSSYQIPLF